MSAQQALELGVVDKVVDASDDLLSAAIAFAESKMGEDLPRISTKPPPSPADWSSWERRMKRSRPGEPAPLAIIRCVKAACEGPTFADGVEHEQSEFFPLIVSPESKALRYMFFAERNAPKVDGLKAKPKPIRSVGIVGAGLMGGGIAMCCANAMIPVTILDIDQSNLDRGMKLVKANYERSRSMSPEKKASAMRRIRPTTSYADLRECDLVIEAVFENVAVKKEIFKKLSHFCKKDAFLCSNTSALDIVSYSKS